jgi:hypothetical protein
MNGFQEAGKGQGKTGGFPEASSSSLRPFRRKYEFGMFRMSHGKDLDPAYSPVTRVVHVRPNSKSVTHHLPFGQNLSAPLASLLLSERNNYSAVSNLVYINRLNTQTTPDCVIARATRRGNPCSRLDCHVATLLAMTMIGLVFPELLTAE